MNTNTNTTTNTGTLVTPRPPQPAIDPALLQLKIKKACIFDGIAIHSTDDPLPPAPDLIRAYEERIHELKTKQAALDPQNPNHLENYVLLRNTLSTLQLHLDEFRSAAAQLPNQRVTPPAPRQTTQTTVPSVPIEQPQPLPTVPEVSNMCPTPVPDLSETRPEPIRTPHSESVTRETPASNHSSGASEESNTSHTSQNSQTSHPSQTSHNSEPSQPPPKPDAPAKNPVFEYMMQTNPTFRARHEAIEAIAAKLKSARSSSAPEPIPDWKQSELSEIADYLHSRSPLDRLPADRRQLLYDTVRDFGASPTADVIARPSPEGWGIKVSPRTLNRFRERFEKRQESQRHKDAEKLANEILADPAATDADLSRATERLFKTRLLQAVNDPALTPRELRDYFHAYTRLRALELAERNQGGGNDRAATVVP